MPGSRLKGEYHCNISGHLICVGLIFMGPDGHPSFASELYVSSASDDDIARDCGFYNKLQQGDIVMFDKGGE